MSKAFTRESDDAPDREAFSRPSPLLPEGTRNYLTPAGHRQFSEELDHLLHVERTGLAARTDDVEAKQQLQLVERRIRQLQLCLQTAEVVPPPTEPGTKVRFGATVTVRECNGQEKRYRIVGVDEADLDRDWVSWISPIARALLKAELGQKVRFRFPSGEAELEIVAIAYE